MIVTIGGEKGGVGKTTVAVHFSYLLAKHGRDPLLLDADPQETASIFCATRQEAQLTPAIQTTQKTGRGLAHSVRDLEPRYTDIVIDTGGRDSIELRLAALCSDVLIVPINPTAYNWWTLERMDEMLTEASLQNEQLKSFVLLNNVPSNPALTGRATAEAVEKIQNAQFNHLGLLQPYLIHRNIYGTNEQAGRTVFEPRLRDNVADLKAQAEISAVFQEVFHDVELSAAGAA